MYIVYWRDSFRKRHHGFVKARTYDEAYDFAQKCLEKGTVITAIYLASEASIDSRSYCMNFQKNFNYF